MGWGFLLSGALAAGLLALGFDLVVPLGHAIDTVCNLVGIASGVVFIGLSDGV